MLLLQRQRHHVPVVLDRNVSERPGLLARNGSHHHERRRLSHDAMDAVVSLVALSRCWIVACHQHNVTPHPAIHLTSIILHQCHCFSIYNSCMEEIADDRRVLMGNQSESRLDEEHHSARGFLDDGTH